MRNNQKPTIEIGIPALNEEANIGYLIESLLKQDKSGYELKRILVSSDGSTDRTVETHEPGPRPQAGGQPSVDPAIGYGIGGSSGHGLHQAGFRFVIEVC